MTQDNSVPSQIDVQFLKQLHTDGSFSTYKVKQKREGDSHTKMLRVLHDIRNHFVLRREKDLLRYLNQFEELFCHFDEIRKVDFSYLHFFDYPGKETLKKHIKKKGPYSASGAKKFLTQMITVLEKAHGVAFVHTDIRPENIWVGKKRHFLVSWHRAIPSLSSYETELMSEDQKYCPPERMNGVYDDSGDIYMLGCTLYFVLTGKHIYRLNKVDSVSDQLYAHANHSMRKPSSLPIFWRQLIQWMTQKKPSDRPSLEDLKQWLKDESVPKTIRKQKIKSQREFPKDSLTALSDQHYLYAIFKKAVLFEAAGDLDSAFNLYENGAFHGYSRAENNLGLMYEKGAPVRQSYIKAMNMYHHAFEKGNPYAAYNLARLFEEGLGTEPNHAQAYKLYKFAALRGNINAQNKLGELYFEGKGTAKDIVQARFWFGMAANFGNHTARLNIKRLLSPADTVESA